MLRGGGVAGSGSGTGDLFYPALKIFVGIVLPAILTQGISRIPDWI
jgi:hypothetical protein